MPNVVVKMPQLGESVAEGTIGRWLKQLGDRVERDEPLVEIQTDKVNAEVPSPVAGFLQQILLPEGTTAAVKTDMAVIGDEPVGTALAPEAAPAAQGPEGTTAKRTPAQAAASAPPLLQTFSYDQTPGGGVVGERGDDPGRGAGGADDGSGSSRAQPTPSVGPGQGASAGLGGGEGGAGSGVSGSDGVAASSGKRFFTPVVLRMAEEHNIDLSTVQGSGTMGRVTRKDVERVIAGGSPTAAPAPAVPAAPAAAAPALAPRPAPAAPAGAPQSAEDRPLTPMRRAIAEHMTRARAEIPDAWSLVEIDVSALVRYRASVLADFQAREGFELTYLPFFIKAVLAGLRAVPELNATWAGDRVTVHRQYNLGIAVSLDNGLIVPVLRDAEQHSIAGVARALRSIVQKARSGKLALDDLQGATFTVNNPGSLGSVMSQPIVPVGQAGIVTMEAIIKRPVVTADDAIAVRSMMNSCLSFDHRIMDGAQALQFLRTLKKQLETVEYSIY